MDPDYIDPEVLKARARAKGNRADDVVVGPRPRVVRGARGGVKMAKPLNVLIEGGLIEKSRGLKPIKPSAATRRVSVTR